MEFNFSQPERIWRSSAGQFLDVVDNKNGQNGSIIREEILYPKVMSHIGEDLTGKLLLDGGCGEGTMGRLAIDRGAKVIGVDVIPEFLKETSLRSSGKEQPVLASLRYDLPFASSSFDIACYNLVLMWLQDIDKVARETERVLKPGGKAVVSLLHPLTALPNTTGCIGLEYSTLDPHEIIQPKVFMRTINKTAGPYPYFHRSISEYLDTFTKAGLSLDLNGGFDEISTSGKSDVLLKKKTLPEFLILTFKK